jgi:twitching motility protein PilT
MATHGGAATAAPAPQPAVAQPRSLEDIHIDELLYIVTEKGASDLHLCPFVEPVIRVDGQLLRLNYEKAQPTQTQRMMYEILTDEQIQKVRNHLRTGLLVQPA